MQKTLKKALAEKFEDVSLNQQQLEHLTQLQQNNLAKKTKNSQSKYITLVASLLFVVLGFSIVKNYMVSVTTKPMKIAQEVAKNHFKLKPLDVTASSIATVADYFELLDFKPVSSSIVIAGDYQLIGGRYCSLKGITAAQIRYTNQQSGKTETVYEVPYNAKLFGDMPDVINGEQPLNVYYNGLKVKMWQEKGLLIAITESE